MEMLLKIWIVIISFINIVPLFLIAQNSPKDYLKIHNDERVEVGVKSLKWDPKLASLARKFVKKHIFDCKKGFYDTTFTDKKHGRSSAYHQGSLSGVDAVNAWLMQKTNYDYKSNTCIDGTFNCIYYAQIIWDETTFLGCAKVKCRNYGGTLVTCFYDSPCHLLDQSPFIIH
ncbi:Pathogenesis-related protein [Arachis hypogaea]|nr:Pathogenesis-related protein [Arachis hypogaea]